MTSISDFLFNNLGRIGADNVDNTQRNLANTRYANYILEPPSNATLSDSHLMFATQQPKINFRGGGGGVGIPGGVIDNDSLLLIKSEQQRAFEPLQLIQRPFATVPYLGKGSVDPVLESQLLQGQAVSDRKSLATVMDKPYIDYDSYPLMSDVKDRVTNPAYSVEESALSGWTRGGAPTREMN
jgi:hypothetical protein